MIDIGIASYNNPDALSLTMGLLQKNTGGDWRCLVVDNASTDPRTREVIQQHVKRDNRFIPLLLDVNTGYEGAVNKILEWSTSDTIAYCDNDAHVLTRNWNIQYQEILDKNPEVGLIGPYRFAAYPIERPGFTEVLWTLGCFWALRRSALQDVGPYDLNITHQHECDMQMRMRMNGWKIAANKTAEVKHEAFASGNPAAQERIAKGVIEFVDKWVKYFCGKEMDYYSENILRWEDWPPNALFLEQWWKTKLPGLNDNPEMITVDGRPYGLIKVPRAAWGGEEGVCLYKGRII